MTGWEGSNRRESLPADWHKTQPRILARDGWQCQHVRTDTGRLCLLPARDVDHVIPASAGGSDDDSNLQSLCPYHHGKKSGAEGGVASGVARRAKRDAKKPTHPGLSTKPGPAQKRLRGPEGPAPF